MKTLEEVKKQIKEEGIETAEGFHSLSHALYIIGMVSIIFSPFTLVRDQIPNLGVMGALIIVSGFLNEIRIYIKLFFFKSLEDDDSQEESNQEESKNV